MAIHPSKFNLIEKLYIGILLAIFGGIVLHAPFSVGLSTVFPQAELLIKSWKEILLVLAGLLVLVILYRKKQWSILKSPVLLLVAAYGALHLLLVPLSDQSSTSILAGLMIDLRYVLFFGLVYIAVTLYPTLRKPFLMAFFVGAFVVAAFALLQVFVLPPDILRHIGYNETTIMPYMTVDDNPAFIRINSTLRGPNPLGAYAVIVLALLFAAWLKTNAAKVRRPLLPVSVIAIGSFVAVWASYSRSALVAAIVAIGLVVLAIAGRRISARAWVVLAVIVLLTGVGLFAARDSNFVANVLLHDDMSTGAAVTSNAGHVSSLSEGVDRMVHQPLGGGIGSTGSASIYGDAPLVIENQYLFIAHEAGWLGLGLFLILFIKVIQQLWGRRADWLAAGVFASGIGLALIGLLLPVWVDDTVAIIWWGMAAVALGNIDMKGESHGRKIHKTSKRTA